MIRGDWNIPVPPPDAPEVTPGIMLAPLMGWDGAEVVNRAASA